MPGSHEVKRQLAMRACARGRMYCQRPAPGFSLIELMLALTLSAILTAGIVALFVQNNQTFALINGQSRMQEGASYAFDFIGRAIRTSGFLGCAPELDNVHNSLNGDWGDIYEYNITRQLEAYTFDDDAGAWVPSLAELPRTNDGNSVNTKDGANTGVPTNDVAEGTDVLVLRRIAEPAARLIATAQPTDDPVVDAPGGDPGFEVGDIVVIADCQQAGVFRVTGLAVNGDQVTVSHAPNVGAYSNGDGLISGMGEPYSREAVIGAIETQIFFIAPSASTNNRGDTPLALWWKVSDGAPVELVQGVSDIDARFGFDTDGDGRANQYVRRDGLADVDGDTNVMDEAVTLRLILTVNSVDAVVEDFTGGNDGLVPLEREFTQTFFLRNRGL